MLLSKLRLHQFRCFTQMECDLTNGITLFTGDNAQGKTSILEAVCVLLRLQSPRASSAKELVRFGTSSLGVRGQVGDVELTYAWSAGKRKLSVDGETCSKAGDYLASSGLVVWMGSEDLHLVRGNAEARRRYLDFAGSQWFPDYRAALRSYDKALRSRNFLLKRDASPNWKEVDAYSEVLIRHGEVLLARRRELVELLSPLAARGHGDVGGSIETLAMRYVSGTGGRDFASALGESRSNELRRRSTVVGPHRDDVRLEVDDRPASQFGSEGQQRTVALALKLAQANLLSRRGKGPPILLIDDVFGELDGSRRNALLATLPEDSQKLVTTTNVDWLEKNGPVAAGAISAHYSVHHGTISALPG